MTDLSLHIFFGGLSKSALSTCQWQDMALTSVRATICCVSLGRHHTHKELHRTMKHIDLMVIESK